MRCVFDVVGRFMNGINCAGLAKMNETSGARETFGMMYLLKYESIKVISHEYKFRRNAIITGDDFQAVFFGIIFVAEIISSLTKMKTLIK